MSVGARRVFWSVVVFVAAVTGASWVQAPKAAGYVPAVIGEAEYTG